MLRKRNRGFFIIFMFTALITSTLYAANDLDNAKTEEEYKINRKDLLEIVVYPQVELNTKTEVDDSGDIFFHFLGRIHVEGLSVTEFTERLRNTLEKDYLVNPKVSVTVKRSQTEKVVIIGQVSKPGTYPYSSDDPLTLISLVSLAGGFSNIANINGTKIVRVQKDGKDRIINVKIGRILDGREKDVILEPDDIVIVPESLF